MTTSAFILADYPTPTYSQPRLPQAEFLGGLCVGPPHRSGDLSFHLGLEPRQPIHSPGYRRRRNIGCCAVLAQPTAMTTSASILQGFRSASAKSTANPTAFRSAVGTPRVKPSPCSSCRRLENAESLDPSPRGLPYRGPSSPQRYFYFIEHLYSLWGSNPRPMAHKTIALTTELREHSRSFICSGNISLGM
jgi:hypothetical protein